MKILWGSCLISVSLYAMADNSIATATAVAATQTTLNTGMMVYWKNQGVQSNIVSLPNGTSYVVPQVNTPNNAQANTSNSYDNQNNQSNKQAFMGSDTP
jgi:hypothetical protein